MSSAPKNSSLAAAKSAKADEFYTQLGDIERELRHYKRHFKGKTVYLNCDDPRVSNFFHYFSYNFETLELKKLIAACYKSQQVDLFSENAAEQAIRTCVRHNIFRATKKRRDPFSDRGPVM